jgi:hypothetical protein
MIINLVIRIIKLIIRFFMKKYAFFYINFLPFLKYLRSLTFYLLYNLIFGRFFVKKTQPAGPYSVYTSLFKLKKLYIKSPYFFFKNQYKVRKMFKSIKKSLRKSKKRKLFLL